jgi:putative transposase
MPDYRRAHVSGGAISSPAPPIGRRTFLTDADVRYVPPKAIGTLRLPHPFVIEAWVLLPDHMHTLLDMPEMRISPTAGLSARGCSRSAAKRDSIN